MNPPPDLLAVARLVLDRLELDAADRGKSHYLPQCLRDELARAEEAEEAKATRHPPDA